MEVRIVAIAWVPAALAAITAMILLRYGMIERTSDAFGLSMVSGSGLTGLLIFEFMAWQSWGVGHFEACFRGAFDPQFRAMMKERISWRNNPLVRWKRP